MSRLGRVVWLGVLFHFRHLSRNAFAVMTTTIWPLVYASLAYFMFQAGAAPEALLLASLGASVMGIWSITTVDAADSIQRQRSLGVLELLVAAPTPFWAVLLPITIASSAIGIYSLVSTLLWGRILFGIRLELVHPVLFVIAVPSAVIGLGLLGLLLASTFVLYRNANALSNLLGEPVWLITGMLVPISLLPGWVAPLSWVLAPTWGIRAIRDSALGGDPLPAILMCLGLGVAYMLITAVCLRHFERLARTRATLALT